MRNDKKVGVLLKGGLGNQLFQIAAGLQSSNGERLEIFSEFTQPRKTDGRADCLFFTLPKRVHENSRGSNRVERKVLALSLKQSLSMSDTFWSTSWRIVGGMINSILFSLKFKDTTHVISGDGVGYSEIRLKPGLNLLNGYFQAHQYPFDPNTATELRSIKVANQSALLTIWIEKAKKEKPIILHLRLGDYKNESGIGVLPPNYYKQALEKLVTADKLKNLWIFTDEINSVDSYVNPPSSFNSIVIAENGLSPAETLELMRYGSAYVIANSTFSWWAAFLAYGNGCTTIMPSPWFQNMPPPVGIKPQNWIEIEYLK